MEAFLVRPGEGETVTDRGERTIRILCAHELLDLTWTRYEPGERGPDPHVHHRHVDAFFVLDGEVEFLAEKGTEPAGPGTLMAAPPGGLHGIRTAGSRRVRLLNLHAPDAGFVARNRSG